MKTDFQLKADVEEQLAWEPAVDERNFAVAVKDGVVTLTGTATTYMEKRAAERAVRHVEGVRGLALDADVAIAPDHMRSDADIAHAALHALSAHTLVPAERVKVEVQDGWVTLTGDVDWQYQLASAENSVESLFGVRGVSNLVHVRPRASTTDIRQHIASALARQALRESRHIAIDVDGGVVTVSGPVKSIAEHDAIVGTAGATKGVTRVIDHLSIAVL